jgi:hypothetical protein
MPTIVTFDLRTYGDQDEADPLSMEPTATPIRVSSIRMDLVGRFHTIFQHWSNRSKRDGLSFRDCVTDSQGVQVGTLRDQPARNVTLSMYGSAVLGRSTDGEEFILKWGSLGRMAQFWAQKFLTEISENIPDVFPAGIPGCPVGFYWERMGGVELIGLNGVDFGLSGIARIGSEIFTILKHVHSVGLVHGDLKNGLILVEGRLKIHDFGSARMYVDKEGNHLPVQACNKNALSVEDCPSISVDLGAAVHVFKNLMGDRTAGQDTFVILYAEIEALGFTDEFDYDGWIAMFNHMARLTR